ncbi:hypothetical protein BH24PSE1_BH24PSE1_07200 [soil metagenome]
MIRLSAAAAIAGSAILGGCAMSVPLGKPFVQLPGTEWRVVAVNGQATPAMGDYLVRFDRSGSFSARFGCNHMGGTYLSVVGTVAVSNLSQTLMGCPEPAATFESQGSAILGGRMRADLADDGRLSLSNGVGTITLVRAG